MKAESLYLKILRPAINGDTVHLDHGTLAGQFPQYRAGGVTLTVGFRRSTRTAIRPRIINGFAGSWIDAQANGHHPVCRSNFWGSTGCRFLHIPHPDRQGPPERRFRPCPVKTRPSFPTQTTGTDGWRIADKKGIFIIVGGARFPCKRSGEGAGLFGRSRI